MVQVCVSKALWFEDDLGSKKTMAEITTLFARRNCVFESLVNAVDKRLFRCKCCDFETREAYLFYAHMLRECPNIEVACPVKGCNMFGSRSYITGMHFNEKHRRISCSVCGDFGARAQLQQGIPCPRVQSSLPSCDPLSSRGGRADSVQPCTRAGIPCRRARTRRCR